MQTTQFEGWYWDYHAAAKRAGHRPQNQLAPDVQNLYRRWCATGTPTPAEAVTLIHDGTS